MASNRKSSRNNVGSIDINGHRLEEQRTPDHQSTESVQERIDVTSRALSLQTADVYYSGILFLSPCQTFFKCTNSCHHLKLWCWTYVNVNTSNILFKFQS
jgi:hypothetical protein